jgi:protein tyrosine phosphatase (PTP) superfamily phosphohydrolase (DUF442 family)
MNAHATVLILPLLLLACGERKEAATPVVEAAPPLTGVENAYEEAGKLPLAKTEPQEYPGLHNVYRLSDNIVSGSEPHGEEAIRKIAEMGVKTILSVDGKVPDQATAAKYGLKYVHVPIQYAGIEEGELARIAKTFREQEGPFYVHCFHGKHRGPAGAAVGRLVLDGAPRDQALAEMRQWCGTSEKYEGLYEVIASGAMPTGETTTGLEWDFPSAQPLGGFRQAMVEVTRVFDHLKPLYKLKWEPDPEHPDLDALNEAEKLAGLLRRMAELDEVKERPEDFRTYVADSVAACGSLVEQLRAVKAGTESSREPALKSFRTIHQNCTLCHAVYRN